MIMSVMTMSGRRTSTPSEYQIMRFPVLRVALATVVFASVSFTSAQTKAPEPASAGTFTGRTFQEFRSRDTCIVADPATHLYYAIGPDLRGRRTEFSGGARVLAYTSKDLMHWDGPQTILEVPRDFWGEGNIKGIWAPELHAFRGKWYLFATLDTDAKFQEQWRNWLPRVHRGTQIFVSDKPLGPFKPFSNGPTLPKDLMTLDGTLWEEDGVPYIVYCHEWVQIKDGTMSYARLKEDLSAIEGEPVRMFEGSDAPWGVKSAQYGSYVTDGPSLMLSKSGKLFLAWSSFGAGKYTVGLAISDSGKLAGPWRQVPEPIFANDGGHPFLFKRFDGQLMMALHSPNRPPEERVHLFEMEDTGEVLKITKEFTNGKIWAK
jgi:arabinan endo-1,5-alpha-L-arabinosidase